MIEADF